MTILLLVNLGLGGSGVSGPVFNPQWAVNSNAYLGPAAPQPVTK